MKQTFFVATVFVLIVSSCDKIPFVQRPIPSTELFDSVPVNLTDINSEYDDYNSAYPPGERWYEREFVFSSNRNSEGEHFDFISCFLDIRHDIVENTLIGIRGVVSPYLHNSVNNYVNTRFEELGPYYWKSTWIESSNRNKYVFMYSNDSAGSQDIRAVVFDRDRRPNNSNLPDLISEINSFENINTEFNECYPFVYKNDLLFTSDREGDYDIYSAEIIDEDLFNSLRLKLSDHVKVVENLSSTFDDKCPFVKDHMLVFASNRESGYGGFDLYYSTRTAYGWSKPINFGADVNTEYDEYRPVVLSFDQSTNNLMIFSSNRPGGLGGFDLYYVGVEK